MISRTLSKTFSTLLGPSVSELSSSTKALESIASGFTTQLDSVGGTLATAAKDTAKGFDSTKTAVCYSRTLATAAHGRIEGKLVEEFGKLTGREERIGVVVEEMGKMVDEGEKCLKGVEKTTRETAKGVLFLRGKLETMEEEGGREMKLLRKRVESLEEESKVNTQVRSSSFVRAVFADTRRRSTEPLEPAHRYLDVSRSSHSPPPTPHPAPSDSFAPYRPPSLDHRTNPRLSLSP